MFDTTIQPTQLHEFFDANAEPLQNAALLLGGRPWLRRTQRILDDLRQSGGVPRRTRLEVENLYGLLTLQFVHDLESAEAAYFAELDPADPATTEICLLSEGLAAAAGDLGLKLDWIGALDSCQSPVGASGGLH